MSDTEKLAEAVNRLATAMDLLASKLPSQANGGSDELAKWRKALQLWSVECGPGTIWKLNSDSPYVYGDPNNGNR